ncbi:ceramide synthase 1-like [Glandiceps talaboti]
MTASGGDVDATTVSDTGILPMPSYLGMLQSITTDQWDRLSNLPANFSYFDQFSEYCLWTSKDVVATLGFAVMWTLLRYILSSCLFKPVYNKMHLDPKAAEKIPECSFKAVWYLCSVLYTYHVLFNKDYTIFQDPPNIFSDWYYGLEIPSDIQLLYLYELGFYIHSVYATIYMDEIRSDFFLMLFHHFLTITLIGFSYVSRYHKIGTLVIFCHDITDVFLEFGKWFVYTKKRNGKTYMLNEHLSNIMFAGFTLSWVVCRLYWYPLKVLYCTGAFCLREMPFVTTFNIMLWALQLINIYWFLFIVQLLIKLALGQASEVTDTREIEEDEMQRQLNKSGMKADGVSNGVENNANQVSNKKED